MKTATAQTYYMGKVEKGAPDWHQLTHDERVTWTQRWQEAQVMGWTIEPEDEKRPLKCHCGAVGIDPMAYARVLDGVRHMKTRCESEPEPEDGAGFQVSNHFRIGPDDLLIIEDEPDVISNPAHYTSHPSGIQPIAITRHETFCLGNVIKYCMRAKYKGNEIQDLKKAAQYLAWEIERLEGAS